MIKTEKRLNFVKQRFGAPNQNKTETSPNMLKDGPNDSKSIKESSTLLTHRDDFVTIMEGKKLKLHIKVAIQDEDYTTVSH